jgi:hypothetical protein
MQLKAPAVISGPGYQKPILIACCNYDGEINITQTKARRAKHTGL